MEYFRVISSVLFIFLLSSCSKDAFPKFLYLEGLRVIDLNLDQPEVNFDGINFTPASVQLTPWIADMKGNGRPLVETVYWCLDPGVGAGAAPTCEGNPTRTQIAYQQSVALTSNFLAPNYVGALNPVTLNLNGSSAIAQGALAQFFGTMSMAQKYNGYSLLVFFEVSVPGDASSLVQSFKRLVFSDPNKSPKNQNPSGLQVQLNGVEITSLNPQGSVSFVASIASTAIEDYFLLNSGGSLQKFQEKPEMNWFLGSPSDGFLISQVSSNLEVNPFRPGDSTLSLSQGRILIIVARDGRGGSQVKRYCDGICP